MSLAPTQSCQPLLSIVVVLYNMRREAPRTLYSLSSAYQRRVSPADYEVLVIENGSSEPLSAAQVEQFGDNFRYLRIEDASPSPAAAINFGARRSNAPFLGIAIDGARVASPGVVHLGLKALSGFERAVVATIGYHLGPDVQIHSPRHGYNREIEDRLLADIDWRVNGYRMFEIGTLAPSSPRGWLGAVSESNLIFLPRAQFDELGGFDERFDLPGGGLVNLDFYRRAADLKRSTLITLFGEATFHQLHGGTMTNKPAADRRRQMVEYRRQYEALRGAAFRPSQRVPLLLGEPRGAMISELRQSCELFLNSRANRRTRQGSDDKAARVPLAQISSAREDAEADGSAGALGFALAIALGLQQRHHLLELGCGALHARQLFISYLEPAHYCGIEPDPRLREGAIERRLNDSLVERRPPEFGDEAGAVTLGGSFDFVFAPSLFGCNDMSDVRSLLKSVRAALKPGGFLLASFVEFHRDRASGDTGVSSLAFFSWKSIANACTRYGLHSRRLDWPHPLETWMVAATDLGRIEREAAAGGIHFLADDVLLTHWRVRQRRAGRRPGFFRRSGQ